MANTIDSHCSKCGSDTYFVFDGEDWECQSCGAYNTNDDNYCENPYGDGYD